MMILISAQSKGSRAEKLSAFARYASFSVPVGIGTLAAYLIERGHKVELWDEAINNLNAEDIKGLMYDSQQPHLFGISCLTASISRDYEIAKMIKEVSPKSVVIFGGIHPTVFPEDVLNTGEGLVDFVITKEGEIPLEALYRAIKEKKDYKQINGLSFRENGKIIHNSALPGPDMDSLPPFPYHLLEKHSDKYDFGFVLGSRGCPYDCIFCSQRSISDRRFTYRSPDKVVDDIELLVHKYGQRLITFIDDNMLTDKTRIKNLCELIVKRGLHKKAAFQGQLRGDAVDESILKSLKSANFVTLDFGLETASERLMVIINKKETVEQNINALKLAKKYNFNLIGTFILGLPTETKEERLQAYRLARQYLDYVRFNNATPYPGTKLYEMARNENRLNVGKDWENLNACGTFAEDFFRNRPLACVPLDTSEVELKRDILKCNLLFSCRWKTVFNLLTNKREASGWFRMPPYWFLHLKEWFYLTRLISKIVSSWLKLFIFIFISSFKKSK